MKRLRPRGLRDRLSRKHKSKRLIVTRPRLELEKRDFRAANFSRMHFILCLKFSKCSTELWFTLTIFLFSLCLAGAGKGTERSYHPATNRRLSVKQYSQDICMCKERRSSFTRPCGHWSLLSLNHVILLFRSSRMWRGSRIKNDDHLMMAQTKGNT